MLPSFAFMNTVSSATALMIEQARHCFCMTLSVLSSVAVVSSWAIKFDLSRDILIEPMAVFRCELYAILSLVFAYLSSPWNGVTDCNDIYCVLQVSCNVRSHCIVHTDNVSAELREEMMKLIGAVLTAILYLRC
jgi:hypothetical protein